MENSTLRQIIRESIQNYIREIDEVAEVAATEARIRKMEEAIEERKNLINMEGLEETMHKMIDKKKIKEIESICLILGDNIFYGQGFSSVLRRTSFSVTDATIFVYRVNNPWDFGVITVDRDNRPISIVEKPLNPTSDLAVTGLYFYPPDVIDIVDSISPSARNELEITSVNQEYLKRRRLNVEMLGRGFAWLDTGSPTSLLDASHFIETIETRQGLKVACLEEIAFNNGWIDLGTLKGSADAQINSGYGRYLNSIYENAHQENPAVKHQLKNEH